MKRFQKLYAAVPIALVLMMAVPGCATSRNQKRALVCPDCRMVEVAVDTSRWEPDQPQGSPTTTIEHTCRGCQGALKTLFKEGAFRHKCSVCTQTAFTCPVSHRW